MAKEGEWMLRPGPVQVESNGEMQADAVTPCRAWAWSLLYTMEMTDQAVQTGTTS
jgi:hypothetical protein